MSEAENVTEATNASVKTFFGIKAGMTRIFNENGDHTSVTVVKLVPNFITQIKTQEKDGYQAYQIGYYVKRDKLVSMPIKGHLKKSGIDKTVCRFEEVTTDTVDEALLGKELTYNDFPANTFIDVSGKSKGKGFQGVMKRHNFQGGPAAHGSHFHRAPGSIGMCATPGRVYKQKKMPGHMGDKTVTMQNLQVVELNVEAGYMLVKGSIPGSKNGFVKIQKAVKK